MGVVYKRLGLCKQLVVQTKVPGNIVIEHPQNWAPIFFQAQLNLIRDGSEKGEYQHRAIKPAVTLLHRSRYMYINQE